MRVFDFATPFVLVGALVSYSSETTVVAVPESFAAGCSIVNPLVGESFVNPLAGESIVNPNVGETVL